MTQQQKRKQQAFTLLELLLVLFIIISIIIIARSQYEKYILRKDIAVVEQDVQLLFDYLDRGFYSLTDMDQQSCQTNIKDKIHIDWSQILVSSLIKNTTVPPVHPDFTISCENPTADAPAQLVISAPLNVEADQMDWYARRLGGELEGTNVVWRKIPSYTYAGRDPYWILSGQLEQFKSALSTPTYPFMVEVVGDNVATNYSGIDFTIEYDDGFGKKSSKVNLASEIQREKEEGPLSLSIQRGTESVTFTASLTCKDHPDKVLSSIEDVQVPYNYNCQDCIFIIFGFQVDAETLSLYPALSGSDYLCDLMGKHPEECSFATISHSTYVSTCERT